MSWERRRKRERRKKARAMSAHAHVGREIEAARTIPVRNASEIHNKGMGGFYFSFTRAFR